CTREGLLDPYGAIMVVNGLDSW
nr:immunoglobulin heavy chain junction region [Macaca mulatta]MOW86899.1 immunoglobulin heavy chain junction region [Macaca mulatta]MOW87269.1 immunoglobulin heavy chain junction region [Macaca mulatta]MOW87767.1 immunoglobulin heavy chain junction region [Macaca mulatta]MOW87770.1 immunoglobulin heavy chain junction region [Macaca mulatta]